MKCLAHLIPLTLAPLALAQSSPPPTTPPQVIPPSAYDIKPEDALSRIQARNLFHPLRGQGHGADTGSERASAIPMLLGTMVAGKESMAMLQWPDASEGVWIEVGKAQDGVTLLEVHRDKVQVELAKGGGQRWIDLEDPAAQAASKAGSSELAQLLAPPEKPGTKKPVPATPAAPPTNGGHP